jgi:hypothetical protein
MIEGLDNYFLSLKRMDKLNGCGNSSTKRGMQCQRMKSQSISNHSLATRDIQYIIKEQTQEHLRFEVEIVAMLNEEAAVIEKIIGKNNEVEELRVEFHLKNNMIEEKRQKEVEDLYAFRNALADSVKVQLTADINAIAEYYRDKIEACKNEADILRYQIACAKERKNLVACTQQEHMLFIDCVNQAVRSMSLTIDRTEGLFIYIVSIINSIIVV